MSKKMTIVGQYESIVEKYADILTEEEIIGIQHKQQSKQSQHHFPCSPPARLLLDILLEILLIARNVLIINIDWNDKMTKETN